VNENIYYPNVRVLFFFGIQDTIVYIKKKVKP